MPTLLVAISLVVLGFASACRNEASPATATPDAMPSPSPSPMGATPNSTILENLQLVRALERASGRSTALVALSGGAGFDGTVSAGNAWSYVFATLENNFLSAFRWYVWSDGRVVFVGPEGDRLRPPPLDVTEIGQAIVLDSPELVRLAREFGANEYYSRYSDAQTLITIRYLAREPVAEIVIRSVTAPCQLGPIYIHVGTGALMARYLRCLDRLTDQHSE